MEVRGRRSEVGLRPRVALRPGGRSEDRNRKSEGKSVRIDSAKDLIVYKSAYELAMEIFKLSKRFPAEEKYALTSQIRRSSRSVCLNFREAGSAP